MKRGTVTKQRKMAVAVAKDVLASMSTLSVKRGAYLMEKGELIKRPPARSARKTAEILKTKCNVCALGACLLSTVSLYGKIQWSYGFAGVTVGGGDVEKWFERLDQVFSREQQRLIESAFELRDVAIVTDDPTKFEAAVVFGQRYKTAKGRLRAIMNNIIKNDGLFVPVSA